MQVLLENSSAQPSGTAKQQLAELLMKYEDIFIKPDGILGQTDLVEMTLKLETANQSKYHHDKSKYLRAIKWVTS